jgi:alpha-tubulin suppressor-like RCC1 family protein
VQGLSDVVSIASSTAFYAVKRDGTVWTWGFDVHGLGPRYSHLIYAALTVPVPLPLVTSARSVACGATHCFAVTPDGALTAWGSNLSGELGIGGYGTPFDGPVQPTSVPGITGVVAVSPGHDHTLALLADGTVMSWGRNDHGQLGDGTAAWRSTAGPVTGLGKVVQVAAGDGTSFALAADGTVWAWGDNRFGALGTGSTSDEPSAVAALVPGLDNVVSIAADLAAYAVVDDDPAVARRSSPRRHVTGTGPR